MTALAERAVLVTGANRGMGREYVGQLLDRGARKVYAAARDPRTIDIDDSRVVSVLDRDTSALRAELETNLFGPLAMASAFADQIGEQSGAIVNVASVLAWAPFGASYSVSKAALWSATDSMRLELAPRGVQVVGVYVGLVDTDMASFSDSPKSAPADVIRQVLDGVESGADEVLADEFTRQIRAQLGKLIHER